MKIKFHHILILAAAITTVSCKKDNYDAPSSQLTGFVQYQGETLGFEYNQVTFQIFQPGYGGTAPIANAFGQDGSFNTLLFNGDYKLVVPNGQGPFIWPKNAAGNPDTINVAVNGGQTLNLEVTPYWMIRNQNISAAGGSVNATFKLDKIVTGADEKLVEYASLYINKTQFVSQADNSRIADKRISGADIADLSNISLSVGIPSITPTQNYVFARVGVKLVGVEDMLYGPLQKISF